MKRNFVGDWIRRHKLLITLITFGICGGIIAYYWRWVRPFFWIGVILLIGFYLIPIIGFFKYHLYWDFKEKYVEFTLQPIWKRAGIIEIQGGSESGKTLLLILLTKYLKGRKWNSIPNAIPGCRELDLAVLQQHQEGNFKEGLTGVNNILLIDEIWNFFSKKEANQAEVNLSSLLWFLSETSKTGWKIFYVTKKGIRLRKELAVLTENKSGVIKVKKHRLVANYWGRKYFCLDINWEGENLAIPFTDLDLYLFDNAWNVDEQYAKNRTIGLVNKLEADQLQKMLGLPSRTQRLKEKMEVEMWAKHTSDPEIQGLMHKQMRKKFWELKRKEGWISLKEQAEASGANLSPEELNIIRKQVDKNHRRGSGVWEKIFAMKVNLAKIRKARGEKMLEEEKDIREQEEEDQTKATKLAEFGSTEEPSETNANIEGNIDMDKIYRKVSKKYRHGSPKWNRAVEKEIDKERQRLGLKIDRTEDELLKEKFPEGNNSEEEEEK
ncbi:MAG: hypothetical protein MRERV_12c005 [Mycoplasmataceae bacterium RV_VA103A]|nr:MAG: hypothetical protein MRERV_12c005 [Mycoplasmataceae bacterium RV_VA103A]